MIRVSILMLLLANQLHAQTDAGLLQHDLLRMQQFFEHTNQYQFTLTKCQFVGHNFSEPSKVQTGELIKQGDMFYHQLSQSTTLRTPSYELSVDANRKKMLMKQFGSEANEMPFANYIIPLKILVDSVVSIRTSIVNGQKTEYSLSLKGCAYDSVHLVVNTQHFYPEKLTYFLKGAPHHERRLEIQFKLESLKPKLKRKSPYALSHYLQSKGRFYQKQQTYSEYNLNTIKF